MNWLKRRLYHWINSANEPSIMSKNVMAGLKKSNSVTIDDGEDLNHEHFWAFKIFPAVGGKIVEVREYNDNTGKSRTARYLIDDTKDFPTALGKIVSMEFLKS